MGNTACYAYDLRGRKTAEYGTALQPSVFAYDDADRLVSLMTFRVPGETIAADPRERTDGDMTTWGYDDASGLMTAKTYADGHGKATLTMTGTGWRLNDRPGRWTGRERLWQLLMPMIRRRATWSPSCTMMRLLHSIMSTTT
ncbi:hypothetical protein [Akkermansia muciniphila]|uniref:hypothetical protein n=1 Tax=Akkermansia muciniphila TaxID=239935 RepID=UPI0029E7D921|nr:hypothetical protein [Akkermansia muciniphila]WPK65434.1 hypothetical protein SBL66_04005 [Akkermansia muciniphila]